MKRSLHLYRFELLLFALMMLIFNKIFIFSNSLYSQVVWPFNMVLLAIASMGVFFENKKWPRLFLNFLFVAVISVPFFSGKIFNSPAGSFLALAIYFIFYLIIFGEVMRQIVRKSEVTESVLFGSLCGFLLLIILSTFSFLLIDLIDSPSLQHLNGTSIPEKYQQVSYFSTITLTTIGYGDIIPCTDNARLLSAFWGVMGQFYLVAVVGIIISKFSAKS